MKANLEIKKRLLTKSGKILRIGDNVSFVIYREALDEFSIIEGTIKDLDEKYLYVDNATMDKELLPGVQQIPYWMIEEDTLRFLV